MYCQIRNLTHATRALTDVAGRWQNFSREVPRNIMDEIQAPAPAAAVVRASQPRRSCLATNDISAARAVGSSAADRSGGRGAPPNPLLDSHRRSSEHNEQHGAWRRLRRRRRADGQSDGAAMTARGAPAVQPPGGSARISRERWHGDAARGVRRMCGGRAGAARSCARVFARLVAARIARVVCVCVSAGGHARRAGSMAGSRDRLAPMWPRAAELAASRQYWLRAHTEKIILLSSSS